MDPSALKALLDAVRCGDTSVDAALARLRGWPFEDLGFAKIDHHRAIRCGFPEVIYCEGKSADQVAEIFARCAAGGGNVLATRASREMHQAVANRHGEAEFHDTARAITLRQRPASACAAADSARSAAPAGVVAILAAGTSDLPVAEEARVALSIMDQPVETCYDVGVAGLHRLLAYEDLLRRATVIIAVAGMEGALPSVVGGLVGCPVIAVPTSVGYGASFQGLTALLAMLTSCAAGVTVVNIDNGFGAAYAAARIMRTTTEARRHREEKNEENRL